jgi:hypothetical protein
MPASHPKAYAALLGLSGLFAAAALATLIPNPGASWENVLGYRSLCTFTPLATALCGLLAGLSCVARARLFGPQAGYRKPWTLPIIVGALLLAVLAFSLPAYVDAKTEARSGASIQGSEP